MRKSWTFLRIAACAAIAVGSFTVAAPTSNAASQWTYAVSAGVNIRSGPGTDYSVVGSAAKGSAQTFDCYLTGTSVYGDTVWGHLKYGKGFIADFYISIGGRTLAQVGVPKCTDPLPKAGFISHTTIGKAAFS